MSNCVITNDVVAEVCLYVVVGVVANTGVVLTVSAVALVEHQKWLLE